MRICPSCRTTYIESDAKICPKDGARLRDAREFAAWEADPLRGAVIAGRYRIVERIGSGGMGAVYRAMQVGLDRHVAVKILKNEVVADVETTGRFEREAKAMSLLTHPNTVRVFDFGETKGGLLYLAMELLEGELLTARLEHPRGLSMREAVSIVRQMLHSLAEAHSKSIVHRDLKPDNIFLAHVEGRSDAVVKILDFGIAKIVQPDRRIDKLETQAGTVFGTPRYMSPEQAQGKPLDGRSDLYSVAVILYQLLVGKAPFLDDDAVVVMARHIKEVPASPRAAAPERNIPEKLEKIVLRALAKGPDARYPSADAFDEALADVLGELDSSSSARHSLPPGGVSRGGVTTSHINTRSKSWIGIAVATLVLLAVGGSIFAWRSRPDRDAGTVEIVDVRTTEPSPSTPSTEERKTRVESRPSGAEVCSRDGTCFGRTPLDVPFADGASERAIVLRHDGYEDVAMNLPLSNTPVTIELLRRANIVTNDAAPQTAVPPRPTSNPEAPTAPVVTPEPLPTPTEPSPPRDPSPTPRDPDPYQRIDEW
jgi:serine/threonine protein kinase